MSGDLVAFVANSSASSLPGTTMCDGIQNTILTILSVAKIVFWMLLAMLHLVCMLAIEMTAPIESLRMRSISWLVEYEIDMEITESKP